MELKIALPKGRLGSDTLNLLNEAKIINNTIPEDSRKLIFELNDNIKLFLVRAWDVPSYIEMGTADLGICGKDDLLEHDVDIVELVDLKFGYCKMTVAGPNNKSWEEIIKKPFVKVATKYPNITRKYFSAISVQAEIIKLYGSVELAAITGMADCIVDIVSTGNTLKENNLVIYDTLFESTARLICSRGAFYKKMDLVNNIKNKLIERLSSL